MHLVVSVCLSVLSQLDCLTQPVNVIGQPVQALVHCSCLTINDFAVQAEMVAVETSIGVSNILWIFYDCLWTIS